MLDKLFKKMSDGKQSAVSGPSRDCGLILSYLGCECEYIPAGSDPDDVLKMFSEAQIQCATEKTIPVLVSVNDNLTETLFDNAGIDLPDDDTIPADDLEKISGFRAKLITQCADTRSETFLETRIAESAEDEDFDLEEEWGGDEIFFEDDFARERLGEFPLRWELLDGYVETASLEGRKVLAFTDNGMGQVLPNMKDKWAWLPEDFTVEYDLFVAPLNEDDPSTMQIDLCFGAVRQDDWYNASSTVTFFFREDGSSSMSWSLKKPGSGNQTQGSKALGLSTALEDYSSASPIKAGEWNHFAFSFNKRAFKGYINGVRIINVPSMEAPGYLYFSSATAYKYSGISNVRIAKGAVPLYDRLLSDGKIVTYAITFETGKADLKPESLVEISRMAKLMLEYPELEFEVQGHCDNTGSDKVNDPLSQKRAEAIVAALADLGISESRLTPVGKGSHEPIASNKTDEGRAKNRRVEFVKK